MNHLHDCLVLLEYLNASGQNSLRKMEADTGIPFSTIREYINPKVLTFKTWDTIMRMRQNRKSYNFYVTTIDKPNESGGYVNISKFNYLQHYGMSYGYSVQYDFKSKQIFVTRINEDEYWDLV